MSAPVPEHPEVRCRRCDSRLAGDQEWCLECGAARTLLRAPPDWRLALALVGAFVTLAVAALVVVVVNLHA